MGMLMKPPDTLDFLLFFSCRFSYLFDFTLFTK